MRKLVITLVLALSLALPAGLLAASPAQAKIEVKADMGVAFNSKYVWRGIVVVDDWVAQPSVTVSVGDFAFNVWADYMLTDQNNRKNEIDEIDLTASYAFSFGKFKVPVGVIRYTFPHSAAPDTTELFAGVSYDWIVTPSVTVYWDIDEAHGVYILGSLGYSLDLPAPSKEVSWKLALAASIGYGTSDNNSFYYAGTDKSGFTDYSFIVSLPVSFAKYFTITPQVVFTGLVDSDIKDNMKATQDENNVYFGVVFSASF
ncbi:MAG: TorF family putative porin [Thermodesulfobacteriota bacterium]